MSKIIVTPGPNLVRIYTGSMVEAVSIVVSEDKDTGKTNIAAIPTPGATPVLLMSMAKEDLERVACAVLGVTMEDVQPV